MTTVETRRKRADYMRAYRARNLERVRAQGSESYRRHWDARRQEQKRYYLANADKVNAANRAWKKRKLESDPDWRRRTGRRHDLKLKREVFSAYGGCCACCGEKSEEFLTMDHVNGGGKQHRRTDVGSHLYTRLRRLGFPKDGYRLLCMNCNFSYGMRGYCPHARSAVT